MTDERAPLRVVVVDDEPATRGYLCDMVRRAPELALVGECAGGGAAVELLRAQAADLVFLDVAMPDLDGFGVIAAVGVERMPPVVFVSAYAEYAVRAFEAYALDYLLKPVDAGRFGEAVRRARERVERGWARDGRIEALLGELRDRGPAPYPEAMAIRSGDSYSVVRVADIEWIEADGNYAKVYVRGHARLITRSLATLEKEVLDPDVFVRVHRSAIVNVKRVSSIETAFHGDLELILDNGSRVRCSRRCRSRLEEAMYFTT